MVISVSQQCLTKPHVLTRVAWVRISVKVELSSVTAREPVTELKTFRAVGTPGLAPRFYRWGGWDTANLKKHILPWWQSRDQNIIVPSTLSPKIFIKNTLCPLKKLMCWTISWQHLLSLCFVVSPWGGRRVRRLGKGTVKSSAWYYWITLPRKRTKNSCVRIHDEDKHVCIHSLSSSVPLSIP